MRPALAAAGAAALLWSLVPVTGAQVVGPLGVAGFANGQTLHVGAIEGMGTRIVDAEVAWAAANVDDRGLNGAKLNEMNRAFQPTLGANKFTHARASGLEVGLATTVDDENQVIVAAKSESSALPKPPQDDNPDMDEVITLDADPVAYASVLRSNTIANWNDSGLVAGVCVLTDDISRGQAYAADVQLLDADQGVEGDEGLEQPLISSSAQLPDRAVSQNTTRTYLVPNAGIPNNYALVTEVRQTIAPIRLLDAEGVPDGLKGLTIEFLGEWVLRATATGHTSPASTLHYGPGATDPQTPVLRILDDLGEEVGSLNTQDLFGDEGFDTGSLGIPDNLIEIAIGEDPRAIAAPGSTPPDDPPTVSATLVSGAVDVVRLKLLNNLPDIGELADLRIGHMEVSALVPSGGISCPIPVDKAVDPPTIGVGQESTVTLTVHNPYDCPLENVVLTDVIEQKEASPTFIIKSGNPTPTSPSLPTGPLDEATVTWNLGTIAANGGTATATLVLEGVSGGVLEDIATAAGNLADCKGAAASGLAVADLNLVGVSPRVELNIETPRTGAPVAATTATGSILAIVATSLGLLVRRRIS